MKPRPTMHRSPPRPALPRSLRAAALGVAFAVVLVASERGGNRADASERGASTDAFAPVARVLQSPRCQNCHPAGDAPLQGDRGTPHSMNVSRRSPHAGLTCTTCHRAENAPIPSAPPGIPGWHMPPDDTPMVFEGRTPRELCTQLKDHAQNGGRSLEDLAEHMAHDPLVLWAWNPGPGRSKPPIDHATFVAHVRRWVEAGGPCP